MDTICEYSVSLYFFKFLWFLSCFVVFKIWILYLMLLQIMLLFLTSNSKFYYLHTKILKKKFFFAYWPCTLQPCWTELSVLGPLLYCPHRQLCHLWENFISSFPICMPFISFYCLIVLDRTSSIMLKRND